MPQDVLWVGQQHFSEWSFVVDELNARSKVCFHSALDEIQSQDEPADLVVIAMSRPGEFSPTEIEKAIELWPRVACLLGSWCCGMKRT